MMWFVFFKLLRLRNNYIPMIVICHGTDSVKEK